MSRSRRPGRPAARRALNHRGLTASRKVSEAISGLFQTYDKLEVVVEESVDDQNWQSDIRNCDVRRSRIHSLRYLDCGGRRARLFDGKGRDSQRFGKDLDHNRHADTRDWVRNWRYR